MSITDRDDPASQQRYFPDWLVRRDPFLAVAETNGLFQAFAVRRRRTWGRRLKGGTGSAEEGPFDWAPWLAGLLVPMMAIATVVLLFATGCLGFLGGVVLTIALQIYRKRRIDRRPTLPKWMGGVLGTSLHRRALMDLATVPARPREYAEALLLEHRCRHWRFGSLCLLTVMSTVLITYLGTRLLVAKEGLALGDYFLLLALVVATLSALPFVYWMGARNAARDVAGRMQELFTLSALELAGKRAIAGLLILLGLSFLGFGWLIALILGVILFVKFVLQPIDQATGWLNVRGMLGEIIAGQLERNVPQLVIGMLVLLAALGLLLLGRWARRSWERSRVNALDMAEYAIPFVQAFLSSDQVEMERLRQGHFERIETRKKTLRAKPPTQGVYGARNRP